MRKLVSVKSGKKYDDVRTAELCESVRGIDNYTNGSKNYVYRILKNGSIVKDYTSRWYYTLD